MPPLSNKIMEYYCAVRRTVVKIILIPRSGNNGRLMFDMYCKRYKQCLFRQCMFKKRYFGEVRNG
jgi:hypothetical protein